MTSRPLAAWLIDAIFRCCVALTLQSMLRPARFVCSAALLVAVLLSCFWIPPALGEGIPPAATQHRRELTRIAQQEFGLDAPVALFAAQIHQESTWRSGARSTHAHGLAQFTPETAAWIAQLYPDLGQATPYSAAWAMRAMVRYDLFIVRRVKPWYARHVPPCEQWAFVLSGYNGGPAWITRDRRQAEAAGRDPDRWFEHTESTSPRFAAAFRENRHYVRRILLDLEPRYISAGWRGRPTCSTF